MIKQFVLATAAAFALSACGAPASNSSANNANKSNINANTAKTVAAAPTKEDILAIEKKAWEAWKTKDVKHLDELLSDRSVSFGSSGRSDKAASMKSYNESKCDIKSYAFSDEQMNMLGPDLAILTFKAAQDYTCDGKKGKPNVWVSSVYVREGDKWKSLFYGETEATNPNDVPKPAAGTKTSSTPSSEKPDALTETLMAIEAKAWDAWKNRDAKGVEDAMAKDFFTVSGSGRRNRAEAIKAWTEPKCEGIVYSFTEAKGFEVTKDVTLVTYKADTKGTCDGKPVTPLVWAASFNMKEGDTWKNAFFTEAVQ